MSIKQKLSALIILVSAFIGHLTVCFLGWYYLYPKRPFEFLTDTAVEAVNYRYGMAKRSGVPFLQEMTEEDQKIVIESLRDLVISGPVPQLHPKSDPFKDYIVPSAFQQVRLWNSRYIYYDIFRLYSTYDSPYGYYEKLYGRYVLRIAAYHPFFEGGSAEKEFSFTDYLIIETKGSQKALEALDKLELVYRVRYGSP